MNNDYKYANNYMYSNGNVNQLKKNNYEDILKLNRGKKVTIYQSFKNSSEWKDSTFTGIIEYSNSNYIILSDPTNGKWYLLLIEYVDFIKFDEEINTIEQFYQPNY